MAVLSKKKERNNSLSVRNSIEESLILLTKKELKKRLSNLSQGQQHRLLLKKFIGIEDSLEKEQGPWTALSGAKRNIDSEEKLHKKLNQEFEDKKSNDSHANIEQHEKQWQQLHTKQLKELNSLKSQHINEIHIQEETYLNQRKKLNSSRTSESKELKIKHKNKIIQTINNYQESRKKAWSKFNKEELSEIRIRQNDELYNLCNIQNEELKGLEYKYSVEKIRIINLQAQEIKNILIKHENELNYAYDPELIKKITNKQQAEITTIQENHKEQRMALRLGYIYDRNEMQSQQEVAKINLRCQHKAQLRAAASKEHLIHKQQKIETHEKTLSEKSNYKAKIAESFSNYIVHKINLKNDQTQALKELILIQTREMTLLRAKHRTEKTQLMKTQEAEKKSLDISKTQAKPIPPNVSLSAPKDTYNLAKHGIYNTTNIKRQKKDEVIEHSATLKVF